MRDLGIDGLPDRLRDLAKELGLKPRLRRDLEKKEDALLEAMRAESLRTAGNAPIGGQGIRDVVWAERLPPLSTIIERRVTGNTLLLRYAAGPHLYLRSSLNLRSPDAIHKGSRSESPRLVRAETRGDSRVWTLSAPTPGPREILWCSDRPVRFEGADKVDGKVLHVTFPEPGEGVDAGIPYPTIQITAHICEEDEDA